MRYPPEALGLSPAETGNLIGALKLVDVVHSGE
jgi:hypothetical protein